MTRQQAIQQFEARLTENLQELLDTVADETTSEAAYEKMGWIGDDLPRLMAKAAMAVWEASVDVQVKCEAEASLSTTAE